MFVVFRDPIPARHGIAAGGDPDLVFDTAGKLLARVWRPGAHTVDFTDGSRREVPSQEVPSPIEIAGPWKVAFPPNLGAPPAATFDKLVSWPQRPEDGIRHFSGTATYTRDFNVSAASLGPGREAWLDLGDVQVIAEVRLNGQDLGILWKPPFRLNATAALKPGANRLEVRVTNLWPNRMIGDERLPDSTRWGRRGLIGRWPDWLLKGEPRPDGRVTFCTRKAYTKNDPLLPSGLLGPVRLRFVRIVEL